MTVRHAFPGDPIRLGTCIGYGQEPGSRLGRLVAIIHEPGREIERYVVRRYAPGDGEFPTGTYITTSHVFLIPHVPGDRPCREEPWMFPVVGAGVDNG
jgi:hypothetical protein